MKLLGLLAAMLLVVGAAVALGGDDTDSPGGGTVALGDVRLVSVESCDELVDWFRSTAEETDASMLGGLGYAGGRDVLVAREMAAAEDSAGSAAPTAGAPTPATSAVAQTGDGEFSTTNVQERDVDEPDTVKTNGEILIVARGDGLQIVDVSGESPSILSTVPLQQGGTELLLSGDRVLTLTSAWREGPNASQPVGDGEMRLLIAPAGEPITILSSIDVSDPANPRVLETRELPGSYRSARASGDAARLVLVTYPNVPQPGPAVWEDATEASDVEARLEEWKALAIESMGLEDWSPNAGDCSSVARTTAPQGLGTTTVLTLDLQGSLAELDRDSVVADAGTIYASTDRLVIATSRWTQMAQPESTTSSPLDGTVTTEVHAFDITDPAQTGYIGSGEVAGYLLNQFALSEHEGNLRIATTEEAPWDRVSNTSQSHSGITVLDGSMQQIGRIDGLGVTERIQAVRYMGDIAYVVTFRQTDPLYAIDLTDPTAPRVAGELKVPGYSAYLHPIDDGRLLGVGQDATDEGRTLGTKVSTYDVSSIDSPGEIDTLVVSSASSSVEWDHRAFVWWDTTRTAVIPIEVYSDVVVDCPPNAECAVPQSQQPFTGAIAVDVASDGAITERGRVTHQPHVDPNAWWPAIQRSVVVGDALYTISDGGVLRSDLASLADEGFVGFPSPDHGGRPIPVDVGGGSGGSAPPPEPAPAPEPPRG